MISLRDRYEPLLRRPYSIYNLYDPAAAPATLQFLYKIYGRGTALMAAARPGDLLSCLFPLGRGFQPAPEDGRLILVAGGAGVASLHPLAAAQVRDGHSPLLLFGGRDKAEVAAAQTTRALGIETLVATDDPHLLVLSGLHDSQVQYWEPTKWVARQRTLRTDSNRLLLKTATEAGHGGPSGRYRQYHETALIYAFLLDLVDGAGSSP